MKFFVFICLTLPCIWAMPSEQLGVEPELTTKINWGPVWDDIAGDNEFVMRKQDIVTDQGRLSFRLHTTSFHIHFRLYFIAANRCEAPNGLGLRNLFRQVEKILPKQQIKDIIKTYDEDSEVKALRAYIQKPQTKEKLKAIRNSVEFQILKDYTCRVLHIDLLEYQKLARTIINPIVTRTGVEDVKGIRGLLKAINAVLPHQQIRTVYQKLLASDEELVKAVANLKSDEFHQLLLNVRNNVPAYIELRKELKELGVPLYKMRELVAKPLGWPVEVPVLV